MSLDDKLRARFAELTFTIRIKQHIAAGNVMIGDFMRTYEAIRINMASRPSGRASLSVGDRARWRDTGWAVTAIDDGAAFIDVDVAGQSPAGAVWAGGQLTSSVYENDTVRAAIEVLFAPPDLEHELSKIDAWNWTPGVPTREYKIVLYDGDNAGEWLVITARCTFAWDSGAHVIRPVGRTGFSRDLVSLFVRPPTIDE
jgi:hypothetical protein